ncbi:MAG: ABC transporter permease subunit [Candidatus Eremiobacteraeota bacterium]|nr:ABC transporter permease subunit [Candidatus Eremiobacteraeota bacterium]
MTSLLRKNWFSNLSNPILYKELSIGLRDRKIFITQTVYLTILSIALCLIVMEASDSGYPQNTADIGKTIFMALFWIQLFLVVIIAPSLTCGCISTEKEKRTYELLIGSLLTPAEIISGKLIHGLAYIFLLLISSLPITATVFFLGGVSPLQIVGGYFVIFALGFLCCQIGQFFSVRENKTANATNQSYLLIFFASIAVVPSIGVIWSYYAYQGTFNNVLQYKSLSFPLWIYLAVNFILVAGFLFSKTVNYIYHQARNMRYLSIFFLIGYLFNLTVLSGAFANGRTDPDELGAFFTFLIMVNLFLPGFFGNRPTFPSKREYRAHMKSVFSKPYFMPILFGLAGIIPVLLVSYELPGDKSPLMPSFFLNLFFVPAFFALVRGIHRILKGSLPFAFFYYLMLIVTAFLPYLTMLGEEGHTKISSLSTFQFLSPTIAMGSLWATRDFPVLAMTPFGTIPMYMCSLVAYLVLLFIVGLLYMAAMKKHSKRQNF